MFGGKFQNVWREAKKWQRRVASFFVDRIPYGKLKNIPFHNTRASYNATDCASVSFVRIIAD